MPATYEPIATTTLGSNTATVTFSSISGSYTDLILVINGGISNNTANAYVQFNGDTATNYSFTALYGTGSAAGSARVSSASYARINEYGYPEANLNWNAIVHIMNYSNTTTNKTFLSRTNQANNGANTNVGLWRSTAAISSILLGIDVQAGSPIWRSGTTFTLYGIASA